MLAPSCDRGGGTEAVYPAPEAFESEPEFVGKWVGRVGDYEGELRIGELSPSRYFGNFTAAGGRLEMALLFEQSLAVAPTGATAPSNLLLFTWQDGVGQRGHGWLKIGRLGAQLVGSSGPLESIVGTTWSLRRADVNEPNRGEGAAATP